MKHLLKKYLSISIILLFCSLFINVSVLTQTRSVKINYKGKESIVGHDIVCFIVKEKYYNDELLKRFEELNYKIALTLPKYRFVFLRTDGKSDILEHYYKFEKEEYVEAVFPYKAGSVNGVPNDPRFSSQWHLLKINMPLAWDITTGDTSIKIAVLDTGIPINNGNLSHEDLQNANRISGQDFTERGLGDENGHGTYVSGIVSAQTNNSKGIAGICFDSKLFMSKISHDGFVYPLETLQGFREALQQGCKIINMSFQLEETSEVVATFDTIMQLACDSNVLVVVAAGNDNRNVYCYPAKLANSFPSNLMVVAATNVNDQKANFSNFGSEISICAPGTGIWTTAPTSLFSIGYVAWDATSYASPIVAGIAGLVKSKFPHYTAAQIKKQIELSADYLQAWSPGDTIYYGAGRVNAYNSVKNLYVPQLYSTIQDALNYATDGQTIVVSSGTHAVNSTITIPAGVTLQIKAGTTVIMGSGCHITSYGKIIALGEANNRIKFTTLYPEAIGWQGILMYGSGSNGSVFKHCDIKNVEMCSGYMLLFYGCSGTSVNYCDISYNLPYSGGIYADNSCLDIYKNKLQNNGGAVTGYNDSFIMFGAMGLPVDCNSGNNAITNNASGIWADYFSRFDLEDYYGLEHNHMNNISGNSNYNARATNHSIIDASCGTNYWGGDPPPGLVIDGTSQFWFGNIPNCIPGLPFNIGVIEENNSIAMTPELKKVASSNANAVSFDISEDLRRARELAYAENYNEAIDIYKSILLNNRDIEYTGQALNGMLFIYRITQDKELLEYLKVYSRGEAEPFTKVAYANALIVSNYVEEALSEYSEIAKKNPKTIHEIVALIQQSYIYYFDKKDVKRANEILAEVEKIAEKDDIHVKQLRAIVARGTSEGGNKEYFGNEKNMQETEVKMAGYSLGNYPNPFNPSTTIQYSIPKDEFVKLTVYDITGRVVKELVNGYKTAGKYNVEFNASSYSSGTYYYKIEAGEYKNIQKMVLIK